MKAEEKEFKEYEGREQSDSLKIKEVKFWNFTSYFFVYLLKYFSDCF